MDDVRVAAGGRSGTATAGTVVFLHAFPLHGGMWARAVAGLPAGWKGFAPHFPGFGGTPPGAGSLDAFAGDVLARLDAAGVDRFVAVGMSMGGYAAFRLAERAPGRVAGLVLCDTRAAPDAPEARERRTGQARAARRDGIRGLADAMVPGLLSQETRRLRPQVEAAVRAMIATADPEGVARVLEALRDRPDSTPLLAGLRVPVLAVVGERDALSPPDEMRRMVAAIPGARLEVLPGAGHLSALETPDAFQAVLNAFLASL